MAIWTNRSCTAKSNPITETISLHFDIACLRENLCYSKFKRVVIVGLNCLYSATISKCTPGAPFTYGVQLKSTMDNNYIHHKVRDEMACLVPSGVRGKRRVSEIDLFQPRHETAFWWRHNGPATSKLTDRIKWPNYPLELIGIHVHINRHNKESLTQRCRRSTNVLDIFVYIYMVWV